MADNGWKLTRHRSLTRRERKRWRARAHHETKTALEAGFVLAPSYLASLPLHEKYELTEAKLARYVATHEVLGGHSKATEEFYVHQFVVDVLKHMRSKPNRLFLQWTTANSEELWDKLNQFCTDPDSIDAIRGGMELEREGNRLSSYMTFNETYVWNGQFQPVSSAYIEADIKAMATTHWIKPQQQGRSSTVVCSHTKPAGCPVCDVVKGK